MLKYDNVPELFIKRIKERMQQKDISLLQIVKQSTLDKDTVYSYLKGYRKISYVNACVLYSVVIDGTVFAQKTLSKYKERVLLSFYINFDKAFGDMTYLQAERFLNVSHSTIYCYRMRKKKPTLAMAVKVAKVMNFSLEFDYLDFIKE